MKNTKINQPSQIVFPTVVVLSFCISCCMFLQYLMNSQNSQNLANTDKICYEDSNRLPVQYLQYSFVDQNSLDCSELSCINTYLLIFLVTFSELIQR